jgi:two-component system OmpR family sensor kinase
LSLRARLVVVMVLLLAAACLVVGLTTGVTLRKALYDRVDGQLTAAADRQPRGTGRPGTPGGGPGGDCSRQRAAAFPQGQTIGTLSARICDEVVDVGVLTEEGQAEPDLSGVAPALRAVPVGAAPRTVDLGELGDYRVVARQLPGGAVAITGLPLAETGQTLYLVAGVVVGVTALVLLAAGASGAVLVRRALRPLSRVAATAVRVSELRLDRGEVAVPQRVADTDPRTEVGQVGAALNRMLEHVGNALRVRQASETRVRQFVADASHELRTPLAAIRGYAELSRRGGHEVPDEVAYVLRRVEAEAQRMTALVEDLLLLARLDAGRPLEEGSVDLTMLVVDAASDAHAAGPEHAWRLDLPDEPVIVSGDSARLHQVVANLLANARAHTPPGTVVTTGVAAAGDRAVLTVTDTGDGISPALLPHVFERFARGDGSRSRAAGSTGLGLAIVYAVVTALGGSVDVNSRPGRTRFTVCLPRPDSDSGNLGSAQVPDS